MKTKEIEGWVSKNCIKADSGSVVFTQKMSIGLESQYVKAKLLLEQPEKKIEITESQLSEALMSQGSSIHFKQLVVEKLFGKDA